jgi:hypothetical protein
MIYTIFCAAVVAIGILSGRLACGNGNEKKSLVLQWTNKKSKARKNKLIVANQVLLTDNYVSNVIKQKVLRKYKKMLKCVNFRFGGFIYKNFGW